MQIVIEIPEISKLKEIAVPINVSESGTSWSKSQLGGVANHSGVYVHFSENEVIYVGQTTKGSWGTFSERLRREFQETSSQNSDLYKLLKKQTKGVSTAMLDLNLIDSLITDSSEKLSMDRKAFVSFP